MSILQFLCYGDAIFPWRTHLRSCHKGDNLTPRQRLENVCMRKVRICVEWHYGEIAELFQYLDYTKNIKLRQQKCDLLYFAASLLRNCHTCLYGNNTSRYFDMHPPLFNPICACCDFIIMFHSKKCEAFK